LTRNGKRCCPAWAIVAIIAGLALMAVAGYLLYKKLYYRWHYNYALDGESQWEEFSDSQEEGPRYTTEKDFV